MTAADPARLPDLRAAGVLLIVAGVGYLVVEAIVAAAWTRPPYSYLENLVPSLGSTACGPSVCSPSNALMNTMFVVHGALFAAAGTLLARALRARLRRVVLSASVVYAVGLAAITVFHHYDGMPALVRVLNITGAFVGIFAGGAVAIAVGLRSVPLGLSRWVGVTGIVLGAFAIAAGLVFFAFSIGPLGLRERVSIYTLLLWQLLLGAALLWPAEGRSGRAAHTAIG